MTFVGKMIHNILDMMFGSRTIGVPNTSRNMTSIVFKTNKNLINIETMFIYFLPMYLTTFYILYMHSWVRLVTLMNK